MKYADVILPLPLENSYTYSIPAEMAGAIVPGSRVIVHFGKRRYYTAIVMHVHEKTPPPGVEVKPVFALLDAVPVLRRPQLRFWQWIAGYYLCKLGDVYKAALPAGLKLESETVVLRNESFESSEPLRPNEQLLLDAFRKDERLPAVELEKLTGIRNVLPTISSLMQKGAVSVAEQMKQGFTPRMEQYVSITGTYTGEDALHGLFNEVKRARKQEQLLLAYLELSRILQKAEPRQEVPRKELLRYSGASTAILDALVKKGVFTIYEKEAGRLRNYAACPEPLHELTTEQEEARMNIRKSFQAQDVCLLNGVTSGGKTEIYARLIDEVLGNGRQVLYLLPEIAITTQLTGRLGRLFGDKLLVYHSKFPDNERVEVWNKLLYDPSSRLVLGVRSALFLPFRNLGLVIVDEEHEYSYKQQDPAPRYHARNAAIVLASMHGAKTLLGSATPSVDSCFNVLIGKYGLAELKTRYGGSLLPEIIVADVKELRRKRQMGDSLFSPVLIEKMKAALEAGEQVILFRNRRGFAPVIECRLCGWTPRCIHCDVSLTWHKFHNRMVCHYCGYSIDVPQVCPACESANLRPAGFGTQKVEEEISVLFPEARVGRLDMDSAGTRSAYERILDDFEKGKTQILIGTQMLSKGLDFGNVSVVGILHADSLLNFPDFRSHERAYQLMVQVSGRAGRRDKQGTVVLQTNQPGHPVIRQVVEGSYDEMVKLQLHERKAFCYPPFFRIIEIVLRSRDEEVLRELSVIYGRKLQEIFGNRLLGPVTPAVNRIQALYIRKMILKIELDASVTPVRDRLETVRSEIMQLPHANRLLVHYNVDPL